MNALETASALELAKAQQDYAVRLRRYFHQNPELGFDLPNTVKRVRQELDDIGVPYEMVCGTGIVATIKGTRDKPVLAIRGDMDALPVQEKTGLAFASQIEGRMHACGHDGHTAMLLGTTKILWGMRDQLRCTVKMVFQPAEEQLTGAKAMCGIEQLEDVDSYIAIHLWSKIPTGKVSAQPGPRMASADKFLLTIKGRGGHGSLPCDAIDPIGPACTVVSEMQHLIAREVNPMDSVVVSICSLRAGTASNIIPEEAILEGSMRTFDPAIRAELPEKMHRILGGICAATRTTYELELSAGTPPVINDPEVSERAAKAVVNALGKEALYDFRQITGSEDFSYFQEKKPGCLVFVGTGGDDAYAHHHEMFDINESDMQNGMAVFVQYVLESQAAE